MNRQVNQSTNSAPQSACGSSASSPSFAGARTMPNAAVMQHQQQHQFQQQQQQQRGGAPNSNPNFNRPQQQPFPPQQQQQRGPGPAAAPPRPGPNMQSSPGARPGPPSSQQFPARVMQPQQQQQYYPQQQQQRMTPPMQPPPQGQQQRPTQMGQQQQQQYYSQSRVPPPQQQQQQQQQQPQAPRQSPSTSSTSTQYHHQPLHFQFPTSPSPPQPQPHQQFGAQQNRMPVGGTSSNNNSKSGGSWQSQQGAQRPPQQQQQFQGQQQSRPPQYPVQQQQQPQSASYSSRQGSTTSSSSSSSAPSTARHYDVAYAQPNAGDTNAFETPSTHYQYGYGQQQQQQQQQEGYFEGNEDPDALGASPPTAVTDVPLLPPPVPLDPPLSPSQFQRSSRLICTTYFLAAWGDRTWEFAAIIFIVTMYPTTLLYASLFGIIENLIGIAFGPRIGKKIDTEERLNVIRLGILGQNLSICLAGILFYMALSGSSPSTSWTSLCYIMILLMGGGAKASSMLSKISIQKDWVPVIAGVQTSAMHLKKQQEDAQQQLQSQDVEQQDVEQQQVDEYGNPLPAPSDSAAPASPSPDAPSSSAAAAAVSTMVVDALEAESQSRLTSLNTTMVRIDLVCSIAAPLVVGLFSSSISNQFAVLYLSVWSFASFFIEWNLAAYILGQVEQLQNKIQKLKTQGYQFPRELTELEKQTLALQRENDIAARGLSRLDRLTEWFLSHINELLNFFKRFWANLKVYQRHRVFKLSFAYCLLYISVLNLGGTMVTWFKIAGVDNTVLAVMRGIAAFIGVISTYAVPFMMKRWGQIQGALVAIWMQVIMLVPVAFAFLYYFQSMTTKIVIILIFLCLSRFGLWSFDLFELQLLQSYISENQRGFFNGIQESVINIAYITSFLLTIIVSDPSYFMIPAILSFFAVLLAALFVTSWATEELGRENPFPKLATFNLFKKQEEEAEAEAEQQEHQQERGQDANVPTSADLVDPSGIAVVEEDLSGQNPFEASQQPLPQQQQQQQYKRLVYHHTLHQQQQQGEESVVDYEPNELQQQDEEDARESGGRNNALNQSVAEQEYADD